MNKAQNYLVSLFRFIVLIITIPIESKISIQKIPKRFSKIFVGSKKEELIQQEFQDVKTLELFCDQGDIIIHTWKQTSTLIEVKKYGSIQQIAQTLIQTKQYEQLLQVQTECNNLKNRAIVSMSIIVPENCDLKIATKSGNIYIKNSLGQVNAQTERGNIEFVDGANDVNLKTLYGNIIIQKESMADNKLLQACTDHGNINVCVPQYINCSLCAQTKHGKIYSDIFITLQATTTKLNDKIYKQQQQNVCGTICSTIQDEVIGKIDLTTKFGTIKIKPYM